MEQLISLGSSEYACSLLPESKPSSAAEWYLDLLKKCLTRALLAKPIERHSIRPEGWKSKLIYRLNRFGREKHFEIVRLTRTAPIGKLAILRVDADLYQSTMDVLVPLYDRLSVGGYAIFDDYQNLPDCRRAIDEFRASRGITDPIEKIDTRAVFWKKTR